MNTDKFKGFLIIGTKTQEEAESGKGLILWMQRKPSFFIRICNKLLLGIRWVDKEDYHKAQAFLKVEAEASYKVEMPKHKSYNKNSDGPVKKGRNTRSGASGDKI